MASFGMEVEHGQNYSFLTKYCMCSDLTAILVLSWVAKVAIWAQGGYSAQSTNVAIGAAF